MLTTYIILYLLLRILLFYYYIYIHYFVKLNDRHYYSMYAALYLVKYVYFIFCVYMICEYMCAFVHVSVCLCTYVRACAYACVSVRMSAYVLVCMNACMCM